MDGRFWKLFEPINIGKLKVKNRIAMAPMGTSRTLDVQGNPTRRVIDHYVERAKGDVGLIIASSFNVENEVDPQKDPVPLITTASIPSFSELSEEVHSFGSRIFVQLTPGQGRVKPPRLLRGQPVSASPSQYYWDSSIKCRQITLEEVESIVNMFGRAANVLAETGIDGVELHGHGGYLFDQFTTAIWNRRTDKYGGGLEGRLTFPIEVLNAIKNAAGKEFVVQYRFGLRHFMKRSRVGEYSGIFPSEESREAGRHADEGLEMAKLLEKAGFDALHVDAGCHESWYWIHPPIYMDHGCIVDLAEKTKQVVEIPVLAVGRLGIPELAERVLEAGKADIIVLGRALLADQNWVTKVLEGRVEDIRPCIGCNRGCAARVSKGKHQSCAINPTNGREKLYKLIPAPKPKRILIAGGGPAGMEAARVAAIRGHKVTLYEKSCSLGGHLIPASVADFKKDMARFLKWLKRQLIQHEVEVELNTEVTAELARNKKPDVMFLATGSKPIIVDIPGMEELDVCTAVDLFVGKKEAGSSVVIVGGGLVGCETALWLAKQGKKVTVCARSQLMTLVPPENRSMLLDLLALNKVRVMSNAVIDHATDDSVIVVDNLHKRKTIKTDTLAMAAGFKADDKLYKSLTGKVAHLYTLGDCREPRNIMGAIWDAYVVASAV